MLCAAGGFDSQWRYAGIDLQLPCRPHHNPSQPLSPPLQDLTPGSWPWPFGTGSSWPIGDTGGGGEGRRSIDHCYVMPCHVISRRCRYDVMSRNAIEIYLRSCHAIETCHVTSCCVIEICHVPCHVLEISHVTSCCHVIVCRITSYAMSCKMS